MERMPQRQTTRVALNYNPKVELCRMTEEMLGTQNRLVQKLILGNDYIISVKFVIIKAVMTLMILHDQITKHLETVTIKHCTHGHLIFSAFLFRHA